MATENISGESLGEEALGDQTIETIVSMYEKARLQQPEEEPHIWLGNVWLGRAQAEHEVDIDEPGYSRSPFMKHICAPA